MPLETHSTVRQSIIDAENEFNKRMEHIEGFEQAVRTMRNMERRREDMLLHDQDNPDFLSFFDECKEHFMETMKKSTNDPNFVFDFGGWAEDIESDIRNKNEDMLSLATEMDEQFEGGWNRNTTENEERMTNPNSVKSFLHILQANGNLNETIDPGITSEKDKKTFRWATYVAWTIAVVGMVIALSFLTADFYVARTNFAIHIERKNITVPYPALTVCGPIAGLPFFSHFPTKEYAGRPLMGIARLSLNDPATEEERQFKYPETYLTNGTFMEEVMSGPNRESCRGMKKETSLVKAQSSFVSIGGLFDKKRLTTTGQIGEYMPNSCYWCVRIGGARKIIAPNRGLEKSGLTSPPYYLALFQSKLFGLCRDMNMFRDIRARELLLEQIKAHAKQLSERGILEFGDYPPNNEIYDALGAISYGFNHTDRYDSGDYRRATAFACNVYFYSGYYYPSEGNPDIRYRFKIENRSWVPIGKGPYYELGSAPKNRKDYVGPDFSSEVDNDVYSTNQLKVLIEDPDQIDISSKFVLAEKKVYLAEGGNQVSFQIERFIQLGTVQYRVDTQDIAGGYSKDLDTRYDTAINILMTYRTTTTEEISSVATVGWSQYVTDVFEFIGLFTGVCVFTLLVAPASSIARAGT